MSASKSAREKAESAVRPEVGKSDDTLRSAAGPTSASNRADQTPSSLLSMNGPSGKTAHNAESETQPTDYPPTHSTADLVASGAKIVGAREVTTVNGKTCVLVSEDQTEYWGSQLLLSQLEKTPSLLPDIVVEAVSKNGRTYRTFSKARGTPSRTFGSA